MRRLNLASDVAICRVNCSCLKFQLSTIYDKMTHFIIYCLNCIGFTKDATRLEGPG